MSKVINNIRNILFYVVIIVCVIIIITLFNIRKDGNQPTLFGYSFYNVLTDSMSPNINSGSLIIVKEIESNDIKKGDIISFRAVNSNNIITHRIEDIIYENEIQFITKGDANNSVDSNVVKGNAVIGKVIFKIPYLGSVIDIINGCFSGTLYFF